MKILLVYPPSGKIGSYNTPTGLLYIGTVLKEKGYNVKLIDCSVEPLYIEILQKEVKDTDILGIYAMSFHIRYILPLLKQLKLLNKRMLIIWGGPHAMLFPEQIVNSPYGDIVCRGEGEEVMLEIARDHKFGKLNLHKVQGIIFKENNRIYKTPFREFIDLNTLPFIDWTLLNKRVMSVVKRSIIRVQASRGCPYRCAFCINKLTNNRTMRYRDPSKVLDEIEYLYKEFGIKRVAFRDEIFLTNRKQVKEIAQGLIDRNINITWIANLRCEFLRERYVDDDYLKLLTDSGCNKLQTGGESGSKRILNLLNKGIEIKDILNFVKRCKKFNFKPSVSFMTGIPTETEKDQRKTFILIREIMRINPGTLIQGPQSYRPYPGGDLYDMCVNQYNLKMPNSLDEWATSELLGGTRPPWVKKIYLNKYLWFSRALATKSFKDILWEQRNNLLKALGILLFSLLSKIRLKAVFYKIPIEFLLLDRYYQYFKGTTIVMLS